MDLGERAESLASDVLGPVILGGQVRPQRPFGPKLALALGEGRQIVDNDLRATVDSARLRVAPTPGTSSSGVAPMALDRLARCVPMANRCASSRRR